MTEKLNFKRIGLLLRYDSAIFRKKLFWLYGGLEGGLLLLVIFLGVKNGSSWNMNTAYIDIFKWINIVYLVGNYLILFMMTKFLHQKISHRVESIPFVMQPANQSEKVWTVHLSYIIGFIFNIGIWLFNVLLLVGIGALINSESLEIVKQWWSAGTLKNTNLSLVFLFFMTISTNLIYIIYLNLNLLFKKNPQPKSFLILGLLGTFYSWYLVKIFDRVKFTLNYYGESYFIPICLTISALLIPALIALFYSFYYKVKEQQIK
ncbi:MAG: hypothetical protein RR202_04785 [Bacteroidales bacterium]